MRTTMFRRDGSSPRRDARPAALGLVLATLGCTAWGCGAGATAGEDSAIDGDDGGAAQADSPDESGAGDGESRDVAEDGADAADDGVRPIDSCFGPAAAAVARAAVPDGFCAWTWATGIDSPRGIEIAPNGDVLVVERGAGRVIALFDGDGDGLSGAAERVPLAGVPGLNHGIAIHGGFLYASGDTAVYRWAYAPGARADLGPPETVIRDIPGGGHVTRTLAFDAEGLLCVSVGSAGNVDPDARRARIRRFVLDALPPGGLGFDSGEALADGMRNEVGLAFDAAGRLWGVENGIDELRRDDLGGDIHDDNPAEELNLVAAGGRFYGYPFCWSEFLLPAGVALGPGTQWAHPSFLGDGSHTDAWCRDPANVVPPAFAMPAHSAPLGVVFYGGASFPADARGDAFVAFHGSWNRDVPTGYKVVRVVFAGGDLPLRLDPFFGYAGPGDRGDDWPHRPVDLGVGPRGEMYVTSDASGVVIAIGYRGP